MTPDQVANTVSLEFKTAFLVIGSGPSGSSTSIVEIKGTQSEQVVDEAPVSSGNEMEDGSGVCNAFC